MFVMLVLATSTVFLFDFIAQYQAKIKK